MQSVNDELGITTGSLKAKFQQKKRTIYFNVTFFAVNGKKSCREYNDYAIVLILRNTRKYTSQRHSLYFRKSQK